MRRIAVLLFTLGLLLPVTALAAQENPCTSVANFNREVDGYIAIYFEASTSARRTEGASAAAAKLRDSLNALVQKCSDFPRSEPYVTRAYEGDPLLHIRSSLGSRMLPKICLSPTERNTGYEYLLLLEWETNVKEMFAIDDSMAFLEAAYASLAPAFMELDGATFKIRLSDGPASFRYEADARQSIEDTVEIMNSANNEVTFVIDSEAPPPKEMYFEGSLQSEALRAMYFYIRENGLPDFEACAVEFVTNEDFVEVPREEITKRGLVGRYTGYGWDHRNSWYVVNDGHGVSMLLHIFRLDSNV